MGKAMKREIRQCSSCGGFCKKSGCERENVPIITSSDVIAGLQMALSQAEAMIERQQHVMQRAMDAWDSTTHQKNGDGRLWQCMEELRAESHNAESNGAEHPTRTPGYRAGTNTGKK